MRSSRRVSRRQRFLVIAMALLLMSVATTASAQRYQLSGRIVDSEAAPIAYATVVVLNDGGQVAGGSTNDQGAFALSVPAGDYTFSARYVGYKSVEREVSIEALAPTLAYMLDIERPWASTEPALWEFRENID